MLPATTAPAIGGAAGGSPAGGFTRVGGARATLRRVAARRPEAWIYAAATAAGLVVAAGAVTGGTTVSPSPGAPDAHHHGHGPGGPPLAAGDGFGAVAAAWSRWMVMVAAMMLPVVAPHARRIALRSLWPRRHRSMAAFLLGYLAVWAVLGTVVVAGLAARTRHPPATTVVVVLVAAAAWQVSAPRRRVLRRCEAPRPSALWGWPADRDAMVTGGRAGLRCTVTCGPAMLAMAVSHSVWLMAGLLVLLLTERARGPNPGQRAGRPHEAVGLVAFAGVAALAAVT